MIIHNIILLYVHSNISALDLVVTTQVISHSIAGRHAIPGVHINLCNINEHTRPPFSMSCGPCGDQLEMSKIGIFSLYSPIHGLTVVLWLKFGHSTTLNNTGYKAHKDMGRVS